jgi:hypothetical protein
MYVKGIVCQAVDWIGRKQPWPNFKVLSQHLPGGAEKNHENVNQHSQSLGQDLNLEPLEYRAEVLTIRP